MKIKNNFKAKSFNYHFNETDFISLNKTYEKPFTLRNFISKNKKNIISLSSYINPSKTNNKNKEILFKKINNSSLCNKSISFYKIKELKKQKTSQSFNSQNIKNKLNAFKIKSIKKDINKYSNISFSHSLKTKDPNNNNINNNKKLNLLGIPNLKGIIFQIKKRNKKNNIKNYINFKKISYSQKNKLDILNINKNKEDENILNIMEEGGKTFYDKNTLVNLSEKNSVDNYKNYNNILLNNIIESNKQKNLDNMINNEINEKENMENRDTFTKKKFFFLIKKFNLLLEEKEIYKKKIILLQNENKKLKENKKEKDELLKNKKINKELKKENDFLKNEINILKNKVNELTINKNNGTYDEIHLNYFDSFCNSLTGINIPSNERYIKKLEKENEELSKKILKYKNIINSGQMNNI